MPDEVHYTKAQTERFGCSGIIEHMFSRAMLRGASHIFDTPVMLDVRHVQGTKDTFRFSDSNGCIPTSEEFWTLVHHVAHFYNEVDDDEIRAHNSELRERWKRSQQAPAEPRPKAKPQKGFVYLLKGRGSYKIGCSKDPLKRSEQLAIQLPFPVELVHHFFADDHKAVEAMLHEAYKHKRLNGEWFNLSDEDVAHIKEVAKQ